MKRIIPVILILSIILSGCAKPQTQSEPVYSATPMLSDTSATVDGRKLDIFVAVDTRLAKLADLIDMLGGSITSSQIDSEPYTCKFTLGGRTFTIAADSNVMGEIRLMQSPVFDGNDWYIAVAPILTEFGYHEFEDNEQNYIYFTRYPMAEDVPVGIDIPILMYHAVSDNCHGIKSLFVSPSELEKQLKYITENGYTPIVFEDFERIDEIEKPIMLTFDDGYEDNYTELIPLLKKYNVKATVFVITNMLGNANYMSEQQIKEMSDSGLVSIQSHTMSHEHLSTLSEQQLETEMYGSKLAIARITGKEPFVLCYPTGDYSLLSLEKTNEYYEFGLLMNGGRYTTGRNPFKITRLFVSRYTSVSDVANMIK